MGFIGVWVLAPVPDEVVAELAAVVGPVVEAQRNDPHTRELWQHWCAAPEAVGAESTDRAATAAFDVLSGACPLDAHVEELYAALDRVPAAWRPLVLTVTCRKGFPAAALAHGLGPDRFGRLPGWFGDFFLDSGQVREALPEVLASLDLPDGERPAVERRTAEWLSDYGGGRPEEAVALLGGIGPLWQAAADAGAGLLGCMFVPG
ncbi:hypothetical protein [Kitasatospora sp. DSM 101779]|uniref:hypothetical protein n=1 Tax=Kitasatospora sp. DSM 101779 TaxID=2853165 RepID=UPI0021D7F12F|nr:hypothetical protein [Kitasatospora sp. DSM 101779]MCU7826367.1 hypothetical protein [Kitasatospora sp. DSM 101779]